MNWASVVLGHTEKSHVEPIHIPAVSPPNQFLAMALGTAVENGPSATHTGDQEEALGPVFWLHSGLPNVTICGVSNPTD